MLKLFYITKEPEIAQIAQKYGVDRIFADMEYIGKDLRQKGLNTVKNHHTVEDVKNLRKVLNNSQLLVRVNPINENSKKEIDSVVNAGTDIIMFPMWRTQKDAEIFLNLVNGRTKTMLLLETWDAEKNIDSVINAGGFDEIHIGLNDLSISKGKKFLFELLADGTVENLAEKFRNKNITFGFGGIGRVGSGNMLPAENIIGEHYRLGSSMAILSRAFCDSSKTAGIKEIEKIFSEGMIENREYEKSLCRKNEAFFEDNHIKTAEIIKRIVEKI